MLCGSRSGSRCSLFHHRRSTGGMECDKRWLYWHYRTDDARDRVRDVVELEIQEDGSGWRSLLHSLHTARPLCPKVLEPKLQAQPRSKRRKPSAR